MSRRSIVLHMTCVACVGMMGNGCPPNMPTPVNPLAGTWSITRGAVSVAFTWTVNSGGQSQTHAFGGQLVPLNAADFPDPLAPLIQQWNNGLADLNAKLDVALPGSVIVTFPSAITMKVADPNDSTKAGTGLYDPDKHTYLFAGDVSGAIGGSQQGAGGVLTAASITGSFDAAALTTTGKLARTLFVVLIGNNPDNLAFTAQISVDYSGQRTGDVP